MGHKHIELLRVLTHQSISSSRIEDLRQEHAQVQELQATHAHLGIARSAYPAGDILPNISS